MKCLTQATCLRELKWTKRFIKKHSKVSQVFSKAPKGFFWDWEGSQRALGILEGLSNLSLRVLQSLVRDLTTFTKMRTVLMSFQEWISSFASILSLLDVFCVVHVSVLMFIYFYFEAIHRNGSNQCIGYYFSSISHSL